jgi:hypothetical protein
MLTHTHSTLMQPGGAPPNFVVHKDGLRHRGFVNARATRDRCYKVSTLSNRNLVDEFSTFRLFHK